MPSLSLPAPTFLSAQRCAQPIAQERLVDRVLSGGCPLVLVHAFAGTGKSVLLRSLADRLGAPIRRDGLAPVDAESLTAVNVWDFGRSRPTLDLGPVVETLADRGGWLVIACRDVTGLAGLDRCRAYGLVREILADELFIRSAEAAAADPGALRAFERSAGWPWLLAQLRHGDVEPRTVERYVTDELLGALPPSSCALVAAVTRLRPGLRDSELSRTQQDALHDLRPLVRKTEDGIWKWAVPFLRGVVRRAADGLLRQTSEAAGLGDYARALWRHGAATDAINAAQAAGDEATAIAWLAAAGGPWYGHRYGGGAFDRVLAGFSGAARETEPVALSLAMRALKSGRVHRAMRLLRERFSEQALELEAVFDPDGPASTVMRIYRLIHAIYEDVDIEPPLVERAFAVLGRLPGDAHLERGLFYNAMLEVYLRQGRLSEFHAAAARALHHYEAAGTPYLTFFIHLFNAIVALMEGRTEPAMRAARAGASALRKAGFPGDADWRIQALLEGCIAHDRGESATLVGFLRSEWQAFSFGELWPSLGELALDYGTRALAEAATLAEAQAFLDRWRIEVARNRRFGLAVTVREIMLLQNRGRWREARLKLEALQPIDDEALAGEEDRHRLAIAFVALRQRAFTNAADPHFADALEALAGNPRVTPRQQISLDLWRASMHRRQDQLAAARARLCRALEHAAGRQCLGPVIDERPLLSPLLRDRRLTAGLELSDRAAVLARRISTPAGRPPGVAAAAGFTGQERRVLLLLCEGCTNKTAARELGVSEPTIKFHLANLYRKLGVGNRRAALSVARSRGWLDGGEPIEGET
jgi:DNA-binding CsgD family transcriptional regulator